MNLIKTTIIFIVLGSCLPSTAPNNCLKGNKIYLMKNYLYKNQEIKLVINDICVYENKENEDYVLSLERKEYYCDFICFQNDTIRVKYSINQRDTNFILMSGSIYGLILGSENNGNFYIITDFRDSGWYVGNKPTGYD